MPSTNPRHDSDGNPYWVAREAETRGRRLYLDDEAFPYATSGEHDLRVERPGPLTVLWVPIVVDGPVTITPAKHRARPSWVREQATPIDAPGKEDDA